jgi:hypothetical protein
MTFIADRAFRIQRFFLGRARVRRTQVYCVGTAKSGTHSLCSMFSRNVAAGHEPRAPQLIEMFFNWHERRIGDEEFRRWILARDRELSLEMESSWLNVLILDFLVEAFPQARFVLTIRDCYSWANSEFKRVLHAPSQKLQRIKLRTFLYDHGEALYSPEEQVLKDTGLYPLQNYFFRWAAQNDQVLTTVPKERLLIIRTDQIRERAYEIADFAGLPRYTIRLDRTHEYRNPVPRQIIREIGRNFLESKVEERCRPLMNRFFPELKSLADGAPRSQNRSATKRHTKTRKLFSQNPFRLCGFSCLFVANQHSSRLRSAFVNRLQPRIKIPVALAMLRRPDA